MESKDEERERLERAAEKWLLSGATLSATWDMVRGGALSRKRLGELRDALFGKLNASTDSVKALAAGPILNPNELVRYRHPRPRKTAAPLIQLSILDICDGHMGRAA